MITLSNGHSFEYMMASGALAYDGRGWPLLLEPLLVRAGLIKPELFTIAIKSLTLEEWKGYLKMWKPWECIRFIPGGTVNKVGLTNPGFYWWTANTAESRIKYGYKLVVSLHGSPGELLQMVKDLSYLVAASGISYDNIVAIEINPSCPNAGKQTTRTIITALQEIVKVCWFPLLLKVSVDQDYLKIATELATVVEAISFNSVPWEIVFPGVRSPLWRLQKRVGGGGGGVSGKPAQKFNWRAMNEIATHSTIPVIASSIMEFDDLAKARALGASAVSFGCLQLRSPLKPTRIVLKDMKRRSDEARHANG